MLISKLDLDKKNTVHMQLLRLMNMNVNPTKKARVLHPKLDVVKYFHIDDVRQAIEIKYEQAVKNSRWAKYIPRWNEFYKILEGLENDRIRIQ